MGTVTAAGSASVGESGTCRGRSAGTAFRKHLLLEARKRPDKHPISWEPKGSRRPGAGPALDERTDGFVH